MPHTDMDIIRAARQSGLCCIPGAATPTEIFAGLAAGANAVKLFPAELIRPSIVRSIRAVVPAEVKLLPVGGIDPAVMADFLNAGASGFGLGSALYKPGMNLGDVAQRARSFVQTWQAISNLAR